MQRKVSIRRVRTVAGMLLAAVVVWGVAFAGTAGAGMFGGWKDAAISEVKASHFDGYESDWPVGRALELKFEDRRWKAVESESGERFVEFRGTITPETNLDALRYWVEDIERQPGSYAARLTALIHERLGKDRASGIVERAMEKGMSNPMAMAVLLGSAFPDYWKVGAEVGMLWKRMEDGYWLLDTLASPGWANLNQGQIVSAILH